MQYWLFIKSESEAKAKIWEDLTKKRHYHWALAILGSQCVVPNIFQLQQLLDDWIIQGDYSDESKELTWRDRIDDLSTQIIDCKERIKKLKSRKMENIDRGKKFLELHDAKIERLENLLESSLHSLEIDYLLQDIEHSAWY